MTEDTEIDVERLRDDLDQIKDAMGLQERYPTYFHLWLVYGLLALLAAAGSQAVETYGLPGWGHAASWGAFVGVGMLYERTLEDYDVPGGSDAKPSVRIQSFGIVAYLVAVLVAVGPLLDGVGDALGSATIYALIVGAIGATYVVTGSSLSAYYVRARDRYAFYVGGAWMLAYAAAMPRVEVLQEWGYLLFGVLFALHGVASYVYLSGRSDE